MNSKSSQITYYIQYGFAEGESHGKNLRRQLKKHGYSQSKTAADAHIIIAHSGGCYLLPAGITPKLIVLVGLPLNTSPVMHTFLTAQKHDIRSFRSHGLLTLKAANYGRSTTNILSHPRRTKRLIQKVIIERNNIPDVMANHTIFVANRHDPWVLPLREAAIFYNSGNAFVSLSGSHDHIWQAPEEYVAIINHYASRLSS